MDGSDAATARLMCLASAVTASAPGTRCRPIAETKSSIAVEVSAVEICRYESSHPPTLDARRLDASSVAHRSTVESGSVTGPSRVGSLADNADSRASVTSACIKSPPTPSRVVRGSEDRTDKTHQSWFTPGPVLGTASRALRNADDTLACVAATANASGSSVRHEPSRVRTPAGSIANTRAYASAACTICECAPSSITGRNRAS